MSEVLHALEHAIGLCGEKHLSFFAAVTEWPNVSFVLNYIKTITNGRV
jgi:hypothetical protein